MVRTQIQLPDEVHGRLKRLAQAKEWSLAETIRRAAEEFLGHYPAPENMVTEWKLPEPRHLGTRPVSAAQLKELARMSATEESLLRDKGVWPFRADSRTTGIVAADVRRLTSKKTQ
jgi:hypothetical protein